MRSVHSRILSILILILIAPNVGAAEQRWTRQLAKGVTLTQIVRTADPKTPGSLPQFINVLVVDPKTPGVEVRAVLAQDRVWGDDATKGRETVSSMVKRTGAVAGVNGDYHNWCGRPDNVFLLDGELVTDPWSRRPVIAIKDDGTFLFDKVIWDNKVTNKHGDTFALAGMNKVAEWDELILFTPRFHHTTLSTGNRRQEVVIETSDLPARPGVPIKGKVVSMNEDGGTPIKPGTVVISGTVHSGAFVRNKLTPGMDVTITTNLTPKETKGWDNVKYTVGGCPWIVRGGKFWMDAEEERIVPAFYDVANPRTAVGQTKDGKLVIVTVDGRQSIAVGMKLSELAEVMLSFGCVEAINLDGGGSTEMATHYGILNGPSDGGERPTATCLAVYNSNTPLAVRDAGFKIVGLPANIMSGQTAQLSLVNATTGKPVPKDLVARAVWSTDGKVGMVDQSGKFYASRANQGQVRAWIDGKVASASVKVIAGQINRVALFFQNPSKEKPDEQKLTLYARDLNGNPIASEKLSVSITGGSVDKSEVVTNENGAAVVTINWTPDFAGTQLAEVRCGKVTNKAERPAAKKE